MHYSFVFEGLMHFAPCVDHSPPSLHPQIDFLRLSAQLCFIMSPASMTSELLPTYFCARSAASGRLTLRDAIVFTISGTTLIEPVKFMSSGEINPKFRAIRFISSLLELNNISDIVVLGFGQLDGHQIISYLSNSFSFLFPFYRFHPCMS